MMHKTTIKSLEIMIICLKYTSNNSTKYSSLSDYFTRPASLIFWHTKPMTNFICFDCLQKYKTQQVMSMLPHLVKQTYMDA